MKEHRRRWILVFLAVAIAAMVLLAAGLGGLELREGRPMPAYPLGDGEAGADGTLPGSWLVEIVIRGALFVVAVSIPVTVVLFFVSPRMRREILRGLVAAAVIVTAILLLNARRGAREAEQGPLSPLSPVLDDSLLPDVDAGPVPGPPEWLVVGVSVGAVLFVAALIVGVAWLAWRSRRTTDPLEELAREARGAIDAIRSGADLENVIVRCYSEMERVLRERRGIQREEAATPREFEARLRAAGLPGDAVHRLTRLFERVRYGAKAAGEVEERQAVACLTAIAEHCEGVR